MVQTRTYTEPVYTIGVAADKLSISVHSLRQYEKEGLIIPHKTATGRRLYSDLEIEKVSCIKQMIQNEGLNFEGIRHLLALIPCWKLRNCSRDKQCQCPSFANYSKPCWATEEKCHDPYPSCRLCPVYQKVVRCNDLKELIFENRGDR